MQLVELRAYCQRRGWEIACEYVDVGISGAKERRPELDRLLADCRRRRADAVVVYRYDRFARSLRQLVNALCDFDALRDSICFAPGALGFAVPSVPHRKERLSVRFWIVSNKRPSEELSNNFYSSGNAPIGSTRDAGRKTFSAGHGVRALTCR